MWIVRWILIALIILIILAFALYNQEQTVYVKFLKWQSANLPLYLFLYLAFAFGMIFWVVVSALNILKLKNQIYRLQRENRKTQQELDRLRNVNIEEDVESVQSKEDQNKTIVE